MEFNIFLDFIYLLTLGLFNDPAETALRMSRGPIMNSNWFVREHCRLESLRKTPTHLGNDRQSAGQDLNPGSPDCEA
jgi:hypothetical protein